MMDYTERIQAAIDFIELKLFEEISAAAVAAQIGFSEYHFHRIFQGMLGESVAAYIRKRRISEAAALLRSTTRSILDLAIMSGFETQESFTRAFKKMFRVSPNQYRKRKSTVSSYQKKRTTKAMIEHLQEGITLTPRFETYGPELVVGMGGSFAQGCHAEIGQLWEAFVQRQGEILHVKPGFCLGVCLANHPEVPREPDCTFVYIAALPVKEISSVPVGMVSCAIPRARYAVFTHKGSLDALSHTVNYIWGTWIPSNLSGHQHSNGPDFELYDHRFHPETRDGEFDIYVPVEDVAI